MPEPPDSRGPARPLIEPAGLAALLAGESPPAVLDVRWSLGGPPGLEAYRLGHIPGARFLDLDADLAAPPGVAGRHPLPAVEVVEAALRRAGVCGDRPAVVYDAADSTAAARAWWLLVHLGHGDVRVLDGGLAAWEAAGLPLTRREPPPAIGDFVARPGGLPVVDAAGAARLARDGVLLDARAAARYRGEVEPVDPVAGHIPGAVSAPTTENVDASGRFLDAAVLRSRFEQLGVSGATPVGAYCGSGVTAAHEILALHLAGFPASLYPGSWSEWITDPDRPVATGPKPG